VKTRFAVLNEVPARRVAETIPGTEVLAMAKLPAKTPIAKKRVSFINIFLSDGRLAFRNISTPGRNGQRSLRLYASVGQL
jgi:hypothetical protein